MLFENIIDILIYNLDYKLIIKLLLVSKKINNDIKLLLNPNLIQINTNIIIDNNVNIKENENNNYNNYIYKCKQLKLLELYNKYKYNYCNEIITINILNELVLRTMPNIYTTNERDIDIKSLVYFGANINTINSNNYRYIINIDNNIIYHNIVIPSIITIIDNDAFINCNLESIIIHDRVIKIGKYAFSNNNLTVIKIPLSITTIMTYAFTNNKLINIILHDNIQCIEDGAFFNNQLIDITIPKYCKHIGSNAFQKNIINKIIIPSYVNKIGSFAFADNKITTVIIDKHYNETLYYELCIDTFTFYNNQIIILEINNNNLLIKKYAFIKNLLTAVILYNTIMLDGPVFDSFTTIYYRYGYHKIL